MSAKRVALTVACGCVLCTTAISQAPLGLDRAVTTALASRGSLRAQVEKLRAAEATERAVAIEPPLRAEFGYGTFPELGIGNDFLLAMPLDLFGKNAAERSVAHAEVLSARAELLQSALELQTKVFTAFSELLAAQEELESARTIAELAQRSYDATEKRIAGGDLAPIQLLKSDLELRRAKQALQTSQLNLVSAKESFAAVLGLRPEDLPAVDRATFALPLLRSADARPDVEIARAAAASANAQLTVSRVATAPEFELQVAHDFWDTSGRYSARAQFVWNFFDYGASGSRHTAAAHTARSAELGLKDLVTQAHAQVASSQSAYQAAMQDYEGYASLAADAKTILEKEQRAFALGGNTLLDVLDASRSFREIVDEQTQSRARLIAAEGKLLSATGTLVGALPEVKRS